MLSLISTQQKLNLLSPGSGKEKTGNDNVGKMKARIDIFTIHLDNSVILSNQTITDEWKRP